MPIGLDTVLGISAAHAQGTKPPLTPDQLSSYIAINADGGVSAFFGKMDMGQGLFTAIGQMVAEELDVPFKRVKVIMGDTAHQREPGRRVRLDRHPVRRQADARGLGRSAARAGRDGGRAAQVAGRPADRRRRPSSYRQRRRRHGKTVTYAELIGGRYFNVQLDWNKQMGNALYAPGKAQPKNPRSTRSSASRSRARTSRRSSTARPSSSPT